MGIPLTIFSLYRLDGEGDASPRYLLLRVPQQGFGNADAGEYDAVVDAAEARRRRLISVYMTDVLARECPVAHTTQLVGELQSYPVGEAPSDGPGGVGVELWVAQTRYGAPWVVLGTAESEDAFWREVEANDDLSSLGPIRPAERLRAHFLADDDESG